MHYNWNNYNLGPERRDIASDDGNLKSKVPVLKVSISS